MNLRIILILMLTLFGCTSKNIEDFRGGKPEFDLIRFFSGEVTAWGIIEDRFGNLKREFKVEMIGEVNGGVLIVEENFYYSDGEKDKRI